MSYIGVICMQCVLFLFMYAITQCYFWKKSINDNMDPSEETHYFLRYGMEYVVFEIMHAS